MMNLPPGRYSGDEYGVIRTPASDVVLAITPPPCSSICAIWYFMPRKFVLRPISSVLSNASSVESAARFALERLAGFAREVRESNVRAFAREPFDGGSADARCAPGHQRDLAFVTLAVIAALDQSGAHV
jgi:hypothetical protein